MSPLCLRPHTRRAVVRIFMVCCFVAAGCAAVPLVVSAHFTFLASSPVAGSTIGQAPKVVQVRFDQVVDPQFARIDLLDTTGKQVAGGPARRDPADPTTLLVDLPALKPGLYTVAWGGVGADGHAVRGNFPFTVSTSGPPAPAIPQAAGALMAGAASVGTATAEAPSALAVLVRWLRYAALGLLVGAFALVVVVLCPLATDDEDGEAREGGAYWRRVVAVVSPVAVVGGVSFLALHLATLLVQAGAVGDPTPNGIARVLFDTEYGTVWRFTAVCAVVALMVMVVGFGNGGRRAVPKQVTLGIVATARRPAPATHATDAPPAWPWVAGFGVSLLLVAALTLSSHAVESQHEPLLALIADGVHLGAMGVWFGGLLVLLWALPRLLRPLDGDARDAFRTSVIARFSPVGLWGVAALLATGIYAMTLHVTRETITTSSYGITLLLKHALVLPLIAAAALNLRFVRPGLARREARATRWLPRLLYVEAGLGVAVLLITATLTQLPPAHPLNGTNAAAADPRLSRALLPALPISVALGPDADLNSGPQTVAMVHDPDVMGVLQVTSGKDGGTLAANLIDGKTVPLHSDDGGASLGIQEGVPFDPQQIEAQKVTALLTFTGADLGQTAVPLVREADGWWRAKGQFFPIRGEWNIQLVVRRENVAEDSRLNFSFTSDPARFAAALPTAPAEKAAPVATGLRFPRLLANGYFGLAIALVGAGLFALTLPGKSRRAVSPRTVRTYRVWSLGAFVVGVIMLGYFSADVTPTGDRPNPLPNDSQTLALGQQVYMQNCAACHGPTGAGNGPLAARLNPPPASLSGAHTAGHTDGDLYYWVSRGIPGSAMPAFSGSLSDQETWAAIRYVRSLQGG